MDSLLVEVWQREREREGGRGLYYRIEIEDYIVWNLLCPLL